MSKTYIPVPLRKQVAQDSRYLCGYCLTPQLYTGIQLVPDHIIPESISGITVRGNLRMACRRCNEHKLARIDAVDPLTQQSIPCLTRARKREHIISFGAKTEQRLSA